MTLTVDAVLGLVAAARTDSAAAVRLQRSGPEYVEVLAAAVRRLHALIREDHAERNEQERYGGATCRLILVWVRDSTNPRRIGELQHVTHAPPVAPLTPDRHSRLQIRLTPSRSRG